MNRNKYLLFGAVFVLVLSLGYLLFDLPGGWLPQTKDKPNIVLITLESTRADHLPCYGYHRNTTPNICDLAEDGVLFENAYSQGTWTYISIPVLLTGLPANSVGFSNLKHSLSEEVDTLPEVLSNHGYSTIINAGRRGTLAQVKLSVSQDLKKIRVRKNRSFLWKHFGPAHWPYTPKKI